MHTQRRVGKKTRAQVYLRMQHISGGKELFMQRACGSPAREADPKEHTPTVPVA